MLELNEENFASQTATGLMLVDFYAPWCGPCRALAPALETLRDVTVVKVNIDECADLAATFAVASIPCLVFLSDGVEMGRMVGLRSAADIQGKVDELNEGTTEPSGG